MEMDGRTDLFRPLASDRYGMTSKREHKRLSPFSSPPCSPIRAGLQNLRAKLAEECTSDEFSFHTSQFQESVDLHACQNALPSCNWSLSEQFSLINSCEKCILEDGSWNTQQRWCTVYAHMCKDGHKRRQGKHLGKKFSQLLGDYQKIKQWNFVKDNIPYGVLSPSLRKTHNLPLFYDNAFYNRMTSFCKNADLDQQLTKGHVLKGSKITSLCNGNVSSKIRASLRLRNMGKKQLFTDNSRPQQQKNLQDISDNLHNNLGIKGHVDVNANNGDKIPAADAEKAHCDKNDQSDAQFVKPLEELYHGYLEEKRAKGRVLEPKEEKLAKKTKRDACKYERQHQNEGPSDSERQQTHARRILRSYE